MPKMTRPGMIPLGSFEFPAAPPPAPGAPGIPGIPPAAPGMPGIPGIPGIPPPPAPPALGGPSNSLRTSPNLPSVMRDSSDSKEWTRNRCRSARSGPLLLSPRVRHRSARFLCGTARLDRGESRAASFLRRRLREHPVAADPPGHEPNPKPLRGAAPSSLPVRRESRLRQLSRSTERWIRCGLARVRESAHT